jgi:hypothetical protein
MPVTRADAIEKFKTLHQKHYIPSGFMVTTVSDDVSNRFIQITADSTDLVWREQYNRHASDRVNIRSMDVEVPFWGHTFNLRLDRPLVSEHRYEFEYYFGFGGHCDGYTETRIILCFPGTKDETIANDIDALLLLNGQPGDPVDAEYASSLAMLLVLSGHVKYWAAVTEFEKWVADVAGLGADACKDTRNKLVDYIFNTITPTLSNEIS